MQSVSWVMKLPFPVPEPKVVIYNDYPKAWEQRYFAGNYLAIDPTIKHGLSSTLPLLWSDEMMQEVPEFWEEAHAHGLAVGFVQSVFDGRGNASMLTLSRDADEFGDAELEEKTAKFVWLAQLAHSGLARLIVPREVPETAAYLTPREREILKLIAGGLTSQQIADRLKLSKRTADFYADEAIRKLGAHNRTDAAVKATLLGNSGAGVLQKRTSEAASHATPRETVTEPKPRAAARVLACEAQVSLTEFESQVLQWAAIGKGAAVTAQIMGISERSVRKARETAGKKLNSNSVLLSITIARERGLL